MATLPSQFSSLEVFVPGWAHSTELARSEKRWIASQEDYQSFYDAMLPLLDDVLEYLDQFELGRIPADALPLYHLALAFSEAAPHVELYECSNHVPNSFDASRFVAAHGEKADR